jgi:hypothetical protein
MGLANSAPNPGSDEAIEQGCTCPIIDNGHGRGSYYGKDTFIVTKGCPLHDDRGETGSG